MPITPLLCIGFAQWLWCVSFIFFHGNNLASLLVSVTTSKRFGGQWENYALGLHSANWRENWYVARALESSSAEYEQAVTLKCMVFEGRMRYRGVIVKYAMVRILDKLRRIV
ncbi:hypothetical protein SISNIDRAFT_464751 [Sistotremastrum niveocremeum HHB9708]|uniref:Uncharacterized protein n=2 Tax=Sistotremastraceae TaxID=3402574 RepID=A0A164WJD5_9AGAM|nr:hypothetical protein SISNIDRAFT_464751 [Sistotremastrum niveocremeum HHB9708]KZT34626.1 hypothetical protein SISSUDRAFT_1036145 [Sistotremastrum suecicum HHB10207 ss-3]